MTTFELQESLPRKSEANSEDLRTPTLDLFNVLTLAKDIAAEPDGRSAKRFAGQIIEDCELEDMGLIRELAQMIRETSVPAHRARHAEAIVAEVEATLTSRDMELAPVACAM